MILDLHLLPTLPTTMMDPIDVIDASYSPRDARGHSSNEPAP